MGSTSKTPHDALFIDTFNNPAHTSPFLEAVLPESILKQIDVSGLELSGDHHVDEKLQKFETDLLFKATSASGAEVLIYTLIEHQSTVDWSISFRTLRYLVRIWDKWLRENKEAKALPPILPVLLSNAPGGWTKPLDFVSLVDGAEPLVDSLHPHLPQFRPVLVDLATMKDEDLLAMKVNALVRLVLLLMKHYKDGDLAQRLPLWSQTYVEVYKSSGFDALVRVLMYILEVDNEVKLENVEFVDDLIKAPEGKVVMTLAERLRQEGREEGLAKGQQRMLLKLLQLRFGEPSAETTSRVQAATVEELEAMAERVLTAQTLEEVLGGGS